MKKFNRIASMLAYLGFLSCQNPLSNVTANNTAQVLNGYTCPMVMSNFFVLVDENGKNLISSNSASALMVLPDKPGVVLDPAKPLSLNSVRLVSDTTKLPPYGGFAALGEFGPGDQTFSLVVNGVNYGTVAYSLTRLGDYKTSKGCFVMNSITFNGKPVNYDTSVGILAPHASEYLPVSMEFYSGPAAPVLVFHL